MFPSKHKALDTLISDVSKSISSFVRASASSRLRPQPYMMYRKHFSLSVKSISSMRSSISAFITTFFFAVYLGRAIQMEQSLCWV
nr:MAG TPA: hypothetical protein [Caudoviricetes sp.]